MKKDLFLSREKARKGQIQINSIHHFDAVKRAVTIGPSSSSASPRLFLPPLSVALLGFVFNIQTAHAPRDGRHSNLESCVQSVDSNFCRLNALLSTPLPVH